MTESPHFKELLQRFNANEDEYLIVGGYAVMKYTEPRFTKDLDLWVSNSEENSNRVYRSLAQFGVRRSLLEPLSLGGIAAFALAERLPIAAAVTVGVAAEATPAPTMDRPPNRVTPVRADTPHRRIDGNLFIKPSLGILS